MSTIQNLTLAKGFKSSGFTLIQLLTTLVIVGIILAYSVPLMTQMFARSAVQSSASNFKNTLDYARRYAVKVSKRVVLCAGPVEAACESGEWSKGWTLFKVETDNNSMDLTPIQTYKMNYLSQMIVQPLNANFNQKIIFKGNGRMYLSDELPTSFIFCHSAVSVLSEVQLSNFNQTYDFHIENAELLNKCLESG